MFTIRPNTTETTIYSAVLQLPYQSNSKQGFMAQSSDLMGDAAWN